MASQADDLDGDRKYVELVPQSSATTLGASKCRFRPWSSLTYARRVPALVIAESIPDVNSNQFCNFLAPAVFCQQELNTSALTRRRTWTP